MAYLNICPQKQSTFSTENLFFNHIAVYTCKWLVQYQLPRDSSCVDDTFRRIKKKQMRMFWPRSPNFKVSLHCIYPPKEIQTTLQREV